MLSSPCNHTLATVSGTGALCNHWKTPWPEQAHPIAEYAAFDCLLRFKKCYKLPDHALFEPRRPPGGGGGASLGTRGLRAKTPDSAALSSRAARLRAVQSSLFTGALCFCKLTLKLDEFMLNGLQFTIFINIIFCLNFEQASRSAMNKISFLQHNGTPLN